jgi:hypothetical protein
MKIVTAFWAYQMKTFWNDIGERNSYSFLVSDTVRRIDQDGRSSHCTNDTSYYFHIRRDTDNIIPPTADNLYYLIHLTISVSHIHILSIHLTPIINLPLQFCCHLSDYNWMCLVSTLVLKHCVMYACFSCRLCSHQVQPYAVFGMKVLSCTNIQIRNWESTVHWRHA